MNHISPTRKQRNIAQQCATFHLERLAESLNIATESLVKRIPGQVGAVRGGEDGEDALLQTFLRGLCSVDTAGLIGPYWGKHGCQL